MTTPQEFVDKWRKATLKERAASQEHFLDLCRLVGHDSPALADPSGEAFTFEAGASKLGGEQGYADVWKKGYFAWEYKGKRKNLDEAYRQLLQYRESLLNPPLLVVSDIDQIVIHTNFTNTVKKVVRLTLADLLTPAGLAQLRAVFFEPELFRAPQTTEQATEDAAREFAYLADMLRKYGAEPQQAAHFLIRLLFCLFAEDTGLLNKGLFTDLVRNTRRHPAAFEAQLRVLFQAMAGGGWFGANPVVRFDGRLFDDDCVLPLDGDGLEILVRACSLDWAHIEPSVLGTLFQRSLDPSKRSQIGAHYTSREDILLIVEPVVMAPLRRRWAEVRAQAHELARQRDAAKPGKARDKRQQELERLLLGFAAELARVRILDAACGSGNFLYVVLKLLLDLWKEVSVLAGDLGLSRLQPLPGIAPSPAQLYGIEINEYAHELAQATIWIGYIQWLNDNGFGLPPEPILKPLDNIRQMDAILAYDEQGHPVEPVWPEADVIVGNPPFLGDKKMRADLGDRYVDDLRKLYAGRLPGQSDLCCYWFEKARATIAAGAVRRAGLLATQGIRGGANRTVLQRIKESGDIFWAQSDRDWILDGANVHVSMVAFDTGTEPSRTLDGLAVTAITPDLTSETDLTRARRLVEDSDISFIGPSPHGRFDIGVYVAERMIAAPPNTNGRPNSDVVRPVVNGFDLTRRPRNVWTIDFATMSLEEAAQYELPFEYVRRHVYPGRSGNRRVGYAERWWQYGEARPGMREALKGRRRFIATPRVAKHRIFAWLLPEVLSNDGTVVFARDDDYFFGVLHSKLHELWALAKGTALEDRPRYTPTSTFETFPLPWAPGKEPAGDPRVRAIAEAARELVEQRDAWLNPEGAAEAELKRRTLTNLYNQRPTWLALAHRKLDEAVLDAYGWPHDLGDEEILERLLALNLERAAGG